MRSLSHKECPYAYVIVEAAFKIINTEFVNEHHFANLYELKLKLAGNTYCADEGVL